MSRLYIAPDTDFLIHGEPLEDLSAKRLDVAQEPTWLFVREVVHQLDDKTHVENARVQRRARTRLKWLRDARLRTEDHVEVFYPERTPDYARDRFDPDDSDDRVLAEIMLFAEQHPDDEVRLLGFDYGMWHRADERHFPVIEDAERFRAASDDPLEKKVRRLEAEIEQRDRAEPNVIVHDLPVDERRVIVGVRLPPSVLNDLIIERARPEPVGPRFGIGFGADIPNDNYTTDCHHYAGKLRDYLEPLWQRRFFTHGLALCVENDADVAAEKVTIDFFVPDFADLLDEEPDVPAQPKKPKPFISLGDFGALGSFAGVRGSFADLDFMRRQPSLVGCERLSRGHVRASRPTLAQRRRWALDPIYIALPDEVPETFQLRYEIRLGNKFGVQHGRLLLDVEHVSLDECLVEVRFVLKQPAA